MAELVTLPKTVVQQALEALGFSCPAPHLMSKHEAAEAALRAALEQPEQGPPTDWEAVAADQAMTIALLKSGEGCGTWASLTQCCGPSAPSRPD